MNSLIPGNISVDNSVLVSTLLRNGLGLKYIPVANRTYYLCAIAVLQNGLALEFVPNHFKDHNICNTAINNNPNAYKFL